MLSSHGNARQFIKKLRPFLGLFADNPCGARRVIAHGVHTLQKPKEERPIRHTNQRNQKSSKLVVKKDVTSPAIFYMRDTVTKISNILRFSIWEFAEEQLEKLSIKWDSFTVTQVLKTHPPMEKAWLFFNWAAKLKNFKHDQYTYTTMLDIFGEAKRISSMKFLFFLMQEKGIKVDAVTYTSLLHWLSNNGEVDEAIKLWQEMKNKGFHPTVVSYTAYMKVLFNCGKVKEATEVYKEMIQFGCPPNCYTYTILMEHLADSGKFEESIEIFHKMQEAGVKPDKATCNILIEKLAKVGEAHSIMQILQYMKENRLVLRYPVYQEAQKSLRLAEVSDILLSEVNSHFSVGHFKREEKDICELDVSSIRLTVDPVLVFYLLNKQNLDAIDYLVADLMDKGIRLDSGIISVVIEVNCSHCRAKGALLGFKYSVKLDIKIEKFAYFSLIGLFIRTNLLSEVMEIVEAMVRNGIDLGTPLSTNLIYQLGRARMPVAAEKVFDLLPEKQKNTAEYTALINAYFSSGDPDKGLKTFERMRRQGVSIAIGTYTVLLAGLEKCGRDRELEFYRKERKIFQAKNRGQDVLAVHEIISNLLFADMVIV